MARKKEALTFYRLDATFNPKKEDGTPVFPPRDHPHTDSKSPENKMSPRRRTSSVLSQGEKPRKVMFKKMRHNDRTAVKGHIERASRNNSKFARWNANERWTWMKLERQKKLTERGNGTAEQTFPDLHNEQEELDYLQNQFLVHLDGLDDDPQDAGLPDATAMDEDDEEPAPGIKTEMAAESDFQGEVFESAYGSSLATPAASYQATRTPSMPVLKLIPEKAVTRTFNVDRMIAESNGITYEPDPQTVRRSWQLINGRLTEWPPFDYGGDEKNKEMAKIFDEYERARETKEIEQEREQEKLKMDE